MRRMPVSVHPDRCHPIIMAGAMLAVLTASATTMAQTTGPEFKLALPAPIASTPPRMTEPYQSDATYRLAVPEAEPRPAPPPDARPFAGEIAAAALAAGIEPALVHAVVAAESAYRPRAVSPKGAIGLMQVMPATAMRYGVTDPGPVQDNLRAGTQHLKSLMKTFGSRLDLVLAAYNAGEGAVRKYNNAIPPYKETREYVPAVLRNYKRAPVESPLPLKPSTVREYLAGTRLITVYPAQQADGQDTQ